MDPRLVLNVPSPRAATSTDDLSLEAVLLVSLEEATERGEYLQGKAREDAPLTAEQLAIQLHVAELEAALQSALDSRFARSFERAIDEDAQMIQFLQELEEREREDRVLALGMSRSASRTSTHPAAAAAAAAAAAPPPPPPPSAERVLGSGSLFGRLTEVAST